MTAQEGATVEGEAHPTEGILLGNVMIGQLPGNPDTGDGAVLDLLSCIRTDRLTGGGAPTEEGTGFATGLGRVS